MNENFSVLQLNKTNKIFLQNKIKIVFIFDGNKWIFSIIGYQKIGTLGFLDEVDVVKNGCLNESVHEDHWLEPEYVNLEIQHCFSKSELHVLAVIDPRDIDRCCLHRKLCPLQLGWYCLFHYQDIVTVRGTTWHREVNY